MIVLYVLLKNIYTYPLKRTAIIIGILSLIASLLFICLVLALNLNDARDDRYIPGDLYLNPLTYRSVNAIILACFQGTVHAVVSALLIYGAVKEKRFFFVPWLIKMCVSILLNIYSFIACFIGTDYHRYFLAYLSILLLQVQVTISIFRHFQELSEVESSAVGIDSQSEFPYGKMTNSVA